MERHTLTWTRGSLTTTSPVSELPLFCFNILMFLLNSPLVGYDSPVIIYSGELPSQHLHHRTTLSATQPLYFLDHRTLPPGEDHQSFSVSGRDLPETFDDGSNPRYLGNVAHVQSRHLTIDNDYSGILFLPLHSPSTNDTLFSNTTQPYVSTTHPPPSDSVCVSSMNQYTGSEFVRKVSERRRKRPAVHFCHLCGADYTSAQNLGCLYLY